jgi:hypothetical protein
MQSSAALKLAWAWAFAATGIAAGIDPAAASATLAVRPLFPSDNVWNVAIDKLPVDANSAAYITTIGATKPVHPDFGTVYDGAPNGIPYVIVTRTQPRVPVSFSYASESDPGPYPIPPDAPIEGGSLGSGDRHVLIVDRDAGKLYELFSAHPNADGSWNAGSGAVFDLDSNALRPATWTSADAAGLPILPGLVRYEEVAAGEIPHALRFTAPQTRNTFIWPARHQASSLTDVKYPPMGQRFRLKQSVDISGFGPNVQRILRALKKYGMFLADNGSSWFLSGAPDPRWNDDELHQLGQLHGSDFEAVDESSLMVDPNSGQTRAPVPASLPAATTAVEFRCSVADRYLMTADATVVAALDAGCIPGWTRTGPSLEVFAATAHVATTHVDVCGAPGHTRGSAAAQIDVRALVCDASVRRLPNVWPQGDVGIPAEAVPNAADGNCRVGTIPVFGLFSQRADLNHRYTASLATRDQMRALGWSADGAGPLGVAMCAPGP